MEQNLLEKQNNQAKLCENKSCSNGKCSKTLNNSTNFSAEKIIIFKNYNLVRYKKDITDLGLQTVWNQIINYVLSNELKDDDFLNVNGFAKLYDIGLCIEDKEKKKRLGQYCTPTDVAHVMANWLIEQKATKVCDVACGTGSLILEFLNIIGRDQAINLIKSENLYLYDIDELALKICKTIILKRYGKELEPYIKIFHCDFLSKDITLPKDCKVISNPPYFSLATVPENWQRTEVVVKTKETYTIFIEKIVKQSISSVIITPFSFTSGDKYYSLRKVLNDYNGFIVAFDNVPGNIFYGKKNGIFNSNTANSVRAAITVVENKNNCKGFRLTPLIRFKNKERTALLNNNVLESFINTNYQIISEQNKKYCKCFKQLIHIWQKWHEISNKRLGDYIVKDGSYYLSMPDTCRYYTTASKKHLNRKGQIKLNFLDKNIFNFIYCFINSSFVYWYWRMFDGGIKITTGLLLDIPVFYDILSDEDIEFFNHTASKMIEVASGYLITKNNIGIQENIKFPRAYRDKINKRLLKILGIDIDEKVFDLVHSNMALEISVE